MNGASKQSCDNCRRRKIKCSRDLPCDKCQQLCLKCSYSDILCRKGPKFRTLYPLAPSHPLASWQAPLSADDANSRNVQAGYADFFSQPNLSSAPCPVQYPNPLPRPITPLPASSTEAGYVYRYPHANNPAPRPYARRLTSSILLAHVNVFIKYLFPIMPVVRREELKRDSHRPERVSPQRYAFLAALCAATHIQLKLDGGSDQLPCGSSISSNSAATSASTIDIDGQALMSGEELLAEAVGARNECDVVEEMDIESLLTSLFLFACYGNLDKQKQAWFYLCQTTSMVFTLGLHRESTYAGLSIEEAEEKRRIFWLLFVTERGYALPQCKPIMLRASIQKPQVLCSDDPILSYGFLNLINLFEKITVNLYDWLAAGGAETDSNDPDTNSSVASSIQSSLCNSPIVSLQGVLEIQQVDILVTQQWLQAMMWRISLGGSRRSSSGKASDGLPFHLPIIVGKAVMGVISAASQGAVDAHGIGMEQKLFDLGTSVAKVAHAYASPPTPSRSHPRDSSTNLATNLTAIPHPQDQQPQELLWSILTTLSRIRGSQSHLFPRLLEQCRPIFGLDGKITLGNYLPVLGSDAAEITGAVTHTGPEFGAGVDRESQKEAITTPGHGGDWAAV